MPESAFAFPHLSNAFCDPGFELFIQFLEFVFDFLAVGNIDGDGPNGADRAVRILNRILDLNPVVGFSVGSFHTDFSFKDISRRQDSFLRGREVLDFGIAG